MKPFGFIYITKNLINGKKYIGQCSYKNIKWETYLGSGVFLKSAIKKYGRQSFCREIICYAFSREDLSYLEIHFIDEYDAVNDEHFYNIAAGGYATRGFSGKTHSNEYKDRMREFGKSRPATDKMRENMRSLGLKQRGIKKTSEKHRIACQKNGFANRGRKHSNEAKSKMRSTRRKSVPIMKNIFVTSPDGVISTYLDDYDLRSSLKISLNCLSKCINHKIPVAKGKLRGWRFSIHL